MRRYISFIISLAFISLMFLSCSRPIIKKIYPMKFEGLTQLVLASETRNINFEEPVKKSVFIFFTSEALIKVDSNVTYDYYLDFDRDGYQVSINGGIMDFLAPPVRVKKPVINSSEVSYPETGVFIKEDKEAVRILESLAGRFIEKGEDMIDERVMQECEKKLKAFLKEFCGKAGVQVNEIRVTFWKS